MNNENLQESCDELGVSEDERKALERISAGERLHMAVKGKAARIVILISWIQGTIMAGFVSHMQGEVYPYSYEPPGGALMPVKVFSGVAGLAGLVGAAYVVKKGGRGWGNKLIMVLGTVLLSILAFAGGLAPAYAMAFMYGVYSRDQEVAP